MSDGGGFFGGLYGVIGPEIDKRREAHFAQQKQRQDAEFKTAFTAMQEAARKLAELKAKGKI